VEKGGSLLIIPSSRTDNCLENGTNGALGLPHFTGLDTHRSRVSDIRMEHRLFAHTMEKPTERVKMPVVFRHYRLAGGMQQGKETLLTLENGDGLLDVFSLGKGCIYLLTVPLEDTFSEFQRHALFVPALYNMALFKNNPPAPYYRMGDNSPIPMETDEITTDQLPELQNAALQFSCIPEIRNSYNTCDIFLHDQVREAGNYALCSNGDTLQLLSFNYDRKESDMRYWTANDLKAYCHEHRNCMVQPLQNLSTAAITEKIGGKSHANALFIWLALAFLLAESLLLRLWKE
jgi:hypothetical protein